MIKSVLISLALLTVLGISSSKAYASWNCEPIYGGGEKCTGSGELLIDKTVKNPDSGVYVNNLGLNDQKFAPGQEVMFRLEIKNIGQGKLEHVKVRDAFPDYVQFNWFELGSSYWDANKREINFEINKLDPGESRQYQLSMNIYPKSSIPGDRDTICQYNRALVGQDINNPSDTDLSQFCITHKILGIKNLPATGMPFGIEFALGLIVLSLFGARLAFVKK